MPATRRIALLLPQDVGYSRAVLRGVQEYALTRPEWVFRDAPPTLATIQPLREWKPHGIVALLFDEFHGSLGPKLNDSSPLSP